MKNYLFMNLILALLLVSCTQAPKENKVNNATQSTNMATSNAGSFDLSKLSLKEKLTDVMAAQSIKVEKSQPAEQTLAGLEVFKTSNPKALVFGTHNLAGQSGSNTNEVLFHYNPKNNLLAFYEVKLYSKKQTDEVIGELNKISTPVFKKTGTSKGAIEIDENGDEVKAGAGDNKQYFVWENKATGVSYYLIETGSGDNITAELTALRSSEKYGKDWIAFRSFNWYQN